MASIEFHGVTKRYPDGTEAVKALDLEIADGEFVILVGPSGCGKSTALRMIAGLEGITEGELSIGGEVVNEQAPKDRDLAMVFQNYALYPHMTVRRNMGFALKLAGLPKREIEAKVQRAAEALDIVQYLDRKPATLSGGQRQRVAMGRAIVREPKAFLMDEPLSNLDAKLRVQMRTEIARLQASLGTTTIYVTHDQVEAMTLGDRVVVMRAGVIQQVGAPRELYARPANVFVAGFMGSPAMNFLAAKVAGDVLETRLGPIPLDDVQRAAVANASEPEVIVGIRPEHFEDAALVPDDANGVAFTAVIDVVEEMGFETYAHFPIEAGLRASVLDELAHGEEEGARSQRSLFTARLDAASRARAGSAAGLWFDPRRIHLFDRVTGAALVTEAALVA